MEGLRRFEAELRDELNVKSVRYLDSSATLVEYRFKPNLRLVGRKYGRLVPALTQALRALGDEAARDAARAVEAGNPVTLRIEDRILALAPDELIVEASSPAGYAVAENRGILIALDTTVTPELRDEGFARELVRHIQDARKTAGFAIADRIDVYLSPVSEPGAVARLVERWGDYVRGETLADRLVLAAPPPHAHIATLEEDGHRITIGVLRR
jgi:isoleucyl-tRNA synthetase